MTDQLGEDVIRLVVCDPGSGPLTDQQIWEATITKEEIADMADFLREDKKRPELATSLLEALQEPADTDAQRAIQDAMHNSTAAEVLRGLLGDREPKSDIVAGMQLVFKFCQALYERNQFSLAQELEELVIPGEIRDESRALLARLPWKRDQRRTPEVE